MIIQILIFFMSPVLVVPGLPLIDDVDRVQDGADADEREGEDDEPAERLHFRQQNDQDKLDCVH
jgi:hypothetical protein